MHKAVIDRATHLNRTKDPQYQGLYNHESRATYSQDKIYPKIESDVRILALRAIDLRPILKPHATA